jgi:hypothetical protein
VFENKLPLTLDFIFGDKNHTVTNLENKEAAEARECTSPEIHELAMLCAGA